MSDINNIKKEIFGKAGKRDFPEIINLLASVEKLLKRQMEQGNGKLRATLDQIEEKEQFYDYPVVFLPAQGQAIFVGDTHGDAEATYSILEQTKFINKVEQGKEICLIFLGDYQDRGKADIKNLEIVLSLKLRYPNNVILMRGNHEEIGCGQYYGFLNSCLAKFDHKEGLEFFEKFNSFFEKLPSVVMAGNGIIAIHGGIPTARVNSLLDLYDEELLTEMRWNDPTDEIPETVFNYRRDGYYMFGEKIFNKFMETVNGSVLIRGHEYNQKGYKLMFSDRLITIFSTGSGSRESGYSDFVLSPKYLEVSLEKKIKKWSEKYLKDIEYKNKDS